MANINVHLDDAHWEKFQDLKRILKCSTNEEAETKIIDITQLYLQQNLFKSNLPEPSNQHNNKTIKLSNNHNSKTL